MSDFDTVTIPEKHYAGYQWREEGVLGFITPYGTDSAALKRRDSVDSWRDKKDGMLTPDVLDNVPQSGFRIIRNVSRYMTKNVVWRVMDPRGFELEITSANMSMLLQTCEIKAGIIVTDCIWGRDSRGNNVLVSVASDVYQAATELTTLRSKKVSLKDVKPGDSVKLQNRDEVVYFGKMNYCSHNVGFLDHDGNVNSRYYDIRVAGVEFHHEHSTDDLYVLRRDSTEQEILDGGEAYYYEHCNSAPKIAELMTESPTIMSKRDVVDMLTSDIDAGYTVGKPTHWNMRTAMRNRNGYFYVEKKSDAIACLMDVDEDMFDDLFTNYVSKVEPRWSGSEWEVHTVNDRLARPLIYTVDGQTRMVLYQTALNAYSIPVTITEKDGVIRMMTTRTHLQSHRGYGSFGSFGTRLRSEDDWFREAQKFYTSMERHQLGEIRRNKYQTIGYKDKTLA